MVFHEKLSLAGADIARSAPELWRKFLEAFEVYADQTMDLLVQSPVDALQVRQGHAQQAAHILKTLQNCVATADKLKGK